MGNIFANVETPQWLKTLNAYVFYRRNKSQSDVSSQPDHAERVSEEIPTIINDSTQNSKTVAESLKPTSSTTTTTSPLKCSDFYIACRDNDQGKVKELLETMTPDEVDRLEPNGSTALHAACFYGHYHIVELLLKKGADRAVQNRHQCIPFDEAKNDDIKELFLRIPNSNRLVVQTGAIEWTLIDEEAVEKAKEERNMIKYLYEEKVKASSIDVMFQRIEKNYVNKILNTIGGIEIIRRFFQKAIEEKDPKWLITAYTAETDYYRVLNTEIACGSSICQNERRYIIALISHHDSLEQYTFIGNSYRVMHISNHDLKRYQVGNLTMTKSFVSSSIDRNIIELLSWRQESRRLPIEATQRQTIDGQQIKSWVVCKYHIKHHRTALHIENISQYAHEGEILIMPYSVFKVKKIDTNVKLSFLQNVSQVTEIHLEECDEYS
ncbi:unnamed protein product [Rotaria socialis]|uniref:Uncharacterized protein n=1 Tax=Rotaria socialis TaxID=392032 RepID=A0A818EWW6_9BILA|nr:unnamed protein product [Rotaria socialis]CAF3504784.1 unnamed protein product [Rotaria socialis]CAF4577592.1 unnamed protein product [Rotaria socialis]CAF4840601.1 unnamed protein product [Rotaria socialis]